MMFPTEKDALLAARLLREDGVSEDDLSLATPRSSNARSRTCAWNTATCCAAFGGTEADTAMHFRDLADAGHYALIVHANAKFTSDHVVELLKDTHCSYGSGTASSSSKTWSARQQAPARAENENPPGVGVTPSAGLRDWLRGQDLNLRPLGYEPNELPGCSTARQERDYRRFLRRFIQLVAPAGLLRVPMISLTVIPSVRGVAGSMLAGTKPDGFAVSSTEFGAGARRGSAVTAPTM